MTDMYIPNQITVYDMEMMDHMGENSLDVIATKFYGRTYQGQQTGDMIGNDCHIIYNMEKDDVDDILGQLNHEPKRHYVGYDRVARKGIYAEGVNAVEYWLGIKDEPKSYENADTWKPGDAIETIRAAPTPEIVLAQLIEAGRLPYGKYLMHVWW